MNFNIRIDEKSNPSPEQIGRRLGRVRKIRRTQFIHYRVIPGSALLPHSEPGEPDPRGGVTLYVVHDFHGPWRATFVSAATCSPFDNYCKSRGRAIAEGRFIAGKTVLENPEILRGVGLDTTARRLWADVWAMHDYAILPPTIARFPWRKA